MKESFGRRRSGPGVIRPIPVDDDDGRGALNAELSDISSIWFMRFHQPAAHITAGFLPYLSTGGTDSGFLREKGVICYGFDPTVVSWEDWDTVHGIDERISVENIVNGTRMLYRVIEKFCT